MVRLEIDPEIILLVCRHKVRVESVIFLRKYLCYDKHIHATPEFAKVGLKLHVLRGIILNS